MVLERHRIGVSWSAALLLWAGCALPNAIDFAPPGVLPVAPVDAGVPCQVCSSWGPVQVAGPIAEPALIELSGLVASRAHPGVLYAHNDSGDSARFFAMSPTGAVLGQFVLDTNPVAVDWEDIALGPCPTGTCVYLGDIGDNFTDRNDYAVYRVPEPEVSVDAPVGTVLVAWERFGFAYPTGIHHNAETLLVHPDSGEVYVLTKHGAGIPSFAFKFPQPLDSSSVTTLIKVANLQLPTPTDAMLTGGDLNPCGQALLLRMYNRLVELRVPDGQPFEAIFTAPAVTVPVSAEEPQGEAVAWSADGKSYFTASEHAGQSLHRVNCQQ